MKPGYHWTEEESAMVMKLRSERAKYTDIAVVMNRSVQSIKNHVARVLIGPEKVAEYRRIAEMNRCSKKRERNGYDPKRENDVVFRPTAEMLEDRFKRELMPPRDLTGILMGDPPVGLSALERRT
jgi:hypothetical protein